GRVAGTEQGHDDRQPHHDLRGGDDHREERDDLAVEVAVHAGEGDEREVAGVEHQLDAHEHHDRVAPDQHTSGADGEQQRRQVQVVDGIHFDASSARLKVGGSIARRSRRSSARCSSARRSLSASWDTSRTWPRSRSVLLTVRSEGVPSGSRPAMSTALCRAYTPGAGSGGRYVPSRTRCSASSRWVLARSVRSRWVSTMAPTAAAISRAPVISKANT